MNANSPGTKTEAVKVQAGGPNCTNSTARTTGPRVSAGVLEITVTDTNSARSTIANATEEAEAGTFVRIVVGHTLPPLWLASVIRNDLVWQVVARDTKALGLWQFELTFGGAR